MRLRKTPGVAEAIKSYEDIVFLRGHTGGELMKQDQLELEVGTGRGTFLATLAAQRPDSFFVGIDYQTEVLYYAARKIREQALKNVRLIEGDAAGLEHWFGAGQISAVYINFCDPWPKARHVKRRLISRVFLEKYRKVVKSDAKLYFKTDNGQLFAFALEEFTACGLNIISKTEDLRCSGYKNPGVTEYELKFYKLGMPVYFCEAAFSGT